MSRGLWIAVLALSGALPTHAVAAGTCYQWKFSANATGMTYQDSPQAAAEQRLAYAIANKGSSVLDYRIKSVDAGTFPAYDLVMEAQAAATGEWAEVSAVPAVTRVDPEGCPDCGTAGSKMNLGVNTGVGAGDSVCAENGCRYSIDTGSAEIVAGPGLSAGYTNITTGTATGAACQAGITPDDEESAAQGDCISLSGGGLMCMGTNSGGKNCGEFNGDQVCVTNVPKGSCVAYGSGGVACRSSSGTGPPASGPAPDNGTPGQVADETGKVASDGGEAYYYDSGTVGGSSAAPTTGPATSGDPEGEESSQCQIGEYWDGTQCQGTDASGGAACGAAPTCSGDAVQCAILVEQYKTRCPDSFSEGDLQSAIGSATLPTSTVDVSTSLSESGVLATGGACPAPPTITVFGETIELDWISWLCLFAAQVSGAVMAGAALVAAGILFKGVNG